MQYKILIVEDEADINRLLAAMLSAEGYGICQAFSGTEAAMVLDREKPDLILLDLMLPGLPGRELLRKVREEKGWDIPVLILSAKSALDTKVDLLKTGADDYITKPFEPEEVTARVCAAFRRRRPSAREMISYKKLEMWPEARKVTVNGRELALTGHEYDLLSLFVSSPGKVYSRESLYELVWRDGYYGENNTVNVHVSNLRKKIKEADPAEEYIQTVYGIGFRLG